MNLNHLAISLIELNPENLSDLEEFKKNLILITEQSEGYLKDVLSEACFEVDALFEQSLESRRAGIARLGVLLEKVMSNGDIDKSDEKQGKRQDIQPENKGSLIFTLSTEFDADLLNEFITENMEWVAMAESAILEWEQNPDNQELINTILPRWQ